MSGPSSSAAASSPKAASSPLAKDQVCSATKEELLASNQTYNVLTPCPLCNSRGTKLSIGLHRSGKAPAPSAPGSISDLEWQNLCNPYSGKWNVEAYVALRGLDDQARRMAFHHMVDAGDSEETLQRFVLDARGAKRKRNEAHHGSALPRGTVLGSGSNGTVSLEDQDTVVKRFRSKRIRVKELRTLQQLQHCETVPKLVPPHPVDGVRMKRYHAVRRVSLRHACKNLRAALEGLWQIGYCHNDLKPDNVMYDPPTGNYVLIDYSNVSPIGQRVTFGDNAYVDPAVRGQVRRAAIVYDQSSLVRTLRYWATAK